MAVWDREHALQMLVGWVRIPVGRLAAGRSAIGLQLVHHSLRK